VMSVLVYLQLHLGLFVFAGYIIFDTQVMVERASMGVPDYIHDSLQLLLDFVAVFVRILIILVCPHKCKLTSTFHAEHVQFVLLLRGIVACSALGKRCGGSIIVLLAGLFISCVPGQTKRQEDKRERKENNKRR